MALKENSKNNFELPAFKGNWQKLRSLVPPIAVDWEETLDSITTFQRDSAPQEQEKLKRFSTALALQNIPQLERDDTQEYFDNTKKWLTDYVSGINKVASGEKVEWAEVKSLASNAEEIRSGSGQDDQAIALLEAINETSELKLSPEAMRQRIAQSVFEEIFQVGTHRVLEYTAVDDGDDLIDRSTQDPLESEKRDLISTIQSNPWTAKEKKEALKTYRAWRKVILDDSNSIDPDEVYDEFEELWKATKGEGVTRKSALHFLQLGEDIYKELEDGGAFDIDLSDYYEEDVDEGDE